MQKTFSLAALALIIVAAVYDFEPTNGLATLAALTIVWLASRLRLVAGPVCDSGADRMAFEMIATVAGLFLMVAINVFVGRREGALALIASIIIVGHGVFNGTGDRRDWNRKDV